EQVLEKDAQLVLAPAGFAPRAWTLRVGHLDFLKIEDGSLRYALNLYPALWLLRFTKNTRKFRDQSAQEIISAILGEHGIKHRFELMRETETRKYCVQYRETNLEFVLRLLEWEGIYFSFEDDGTLLLADDSPSSQPILGPPAFELSEAAGALQWADVGIFSFRAGRKVVSGAATVSDFNWKKPKVALLATEKAKEDSELEVYSYPAGYRRGDQGSVIAKRRLEALRVPAKFVKGSGNVTTFTPARRFVFGILADLRMAGPYVLTEVEHHYINRQFQKSELGNEVNYRNHFTAIPRSIPFRPPLVTAVPEVAGTHTAMVVGPDGEEIHTDTHGRFRAKFHWDRDAKGNDEDSRWLRSTQEVATSMVLARVGWEQTVAYIDGDPDRPIGVARNINGHMVSEYGQPANKTRMTMKSPSYPKASGGFNELRLEDVKGLMHFDWHAEKDMVSAIENDRSETIVGNDTKDVGSASSGFVGHDQNVEIGGDYEVTIEQSQLATVTGNRTKKVTGNETFEITDGYAYTVQGDDTEQVKGNRVVKAAEKSGAISRVVVDELEREITGTYLAKGGGNILVTVQGEFTETVGTNKTITVEEGGISLRVGGKLEVEIGGDATREASSNIGHASKRAVREVTGTVTMHGGTKMLLAGDEIVLSARQSIRFKSGALELSLAPGQTTIAGTMKIDAKGAISVTGGPDNLT
ncbi:MAG: type VI secretion system tip protein VgrG, partial [Myxococcales bacterium]|nr:type VI secretion system tip protein VgrG [Myxococcales bacterium]